MLGRAHLGWGFSLREPGFKRVFRLCNCCSISGYGVQRVFKRSGRFRGSRHLLRAGGQLPPGARGRAHVGRGARERSPYARATAAAALLAQPPDAGLELCSWAQAALTADLSHDEEGLPTAAQRSPDSRVLQGVPGLPGSR